MEKNTSTPRRLRRSKPTLLRLEPRVMFDGAGAVDAITVLATDEVEHYIAPPAVDETEVAGAEPLAIDFAETDEQVKTEILAYLSGDDAMEKLFAILHGNQSEPSAEWLEQAEQLLTLLQEGDYEVNIRFLGEDQMPGLFAAFADNGPDGEPTIFINLDWWNQAEPERRLQVLIEEYGHSFDHFLNADNDTMGDEGEAFAAAVLDIELNVLDQARIAVQNDHTTIIVDGEEFTVETANFNFVNAYEMVYDLNNNGQIDNTERWAEKEQNTHYFNTDPLGQVGVLDDKDSRYFSGNDISAIGLNINGTDYYGWISRPIKANGVVRGFYFWTDVNFVDLETAQADGNQDADRNVADNRGFILVIDQAWFDGQIASGTTQYTINNAKDGNLGTTSVAAVGSSSDRVDSALNALVDANEPPVVANIISGTTPNTFAAIEGVDGASGQDANGSLLTTASDPDGDALSVTHIGAGNGASMLSVGDTPVTVDGLYGTLTVNPNGSYSYAVNNTHPSVDALNVGDTLGDLYTFTVSDGNGGTTSATLTIVIQGQNDSPTANPDYNQAKETITLGGSGFNYTGYAATGNVLANDDDVDDSTSSMSIVGVEVNGEVGANTINVTQGASELYFAPDSNGFNSVKAGHGIYVSMTDVTGTSYRSLLYHDGTEGSPYIKVKLSQDPVTDAAATTITLNHTPTHYYTSSGMVEIPEFGAFIASNNATLFLSSEADSATGQQGKTASALSTETTGFTTITDLADLSGTIAIGMTVSGNGVPDGTKVSDLTYTDGVLTAIVLDKELTSTAAGTFAFTGSAGVAETLQGAHGELVLNANGSYVYTPYTDNTLLNEGDSAIEVFDYTMQDSGNVQSSNQLFITVYGTGQNDPHLINDTAEATEAGVVAGSTATGNVLTNDNETFNSGTPGTNEVTRIGLQGGSTTTDLNNPIVGSYGSLSIAANGDFTYTVDNSNSVVDALAPGETLTEVFIYQATNTHTNSSWASLTITINGANDAPVAVADTNSTRENAYNNISGSVLVNDSDIDNGDTLTVSQAGTGSADTAVTAGTSFSNGQSITGTYGTLTIGADGTYTYEVTASLAKDVVVTDEFHYEVADSHGGTATSTLTITITGDNEPPVNSFPATVSTSAGNPISFTDANLVSVADDDGNLSWVALAADHGTLGLTLAGGAQFSYGASGDKELVISGTQADINATLASLIYTPDDAFAGTDYLTIMSQDSDNENDSDSIEITVNASLTVTGYGPVNEGSDYAMFEVIGFDGQTLELAVQDGTTTLGTPTIEYSTDGSTWSTYSVGNQPTLPANGTLYVRVDISNEHDDVYEGSETFRLVATDITDGTLTANAETSIIDDGTGTKYGPNMPGGTPDSNTDNLDDDRELTVTGYGPVNEGSDYAMFEVVGFDGQTLELAVQDGTTDLGNPTIQYSTDGSTWTTYSDGTKPTLPANGTLYVRVDISNEHDDIYEGSETFRLVATDANDSNLTANAQTSIIDDGTGTKYGPNMPGGTPDSNTDNLDDDRELTVTGYGPVNEGSDYAMFEVVGFDGQTLELAVLDGTTTLGTPTIEYSIDGSTWSTYSVGNQPTLPANGTLYVRVDISNEHDDVYEGSETFRLVATDITDGTLTANAQTSIIDDGTGTKYGPNMPGGTPDSNTDNLDDDTPGLTLDNTSLITSENGSIDSFTVVLDSQPTHDVTITITGLDDTEGALSTSTLTFTPANWNTPQTVTVTGIGDDVLDGNQTYPLSLTTNSTDGNYHGLLATVAVTNQDIEVAPESAPAIEPDPVVTLVPDPVVDSTPIPVYEPAFASAEPAQTEPAPWEEFSLDEDIVDDHELRVERDIPTQTTEPGEELSFTIPTDTFEHTDQQATLTLVATMNDGSPLPDWLEFDQDTGEISGMPPADFQGEIQVRVVARDQVGRQAETIVSIQAPEVVNTNAPSANQGAEVTSVTASQTNLVAAIPTSSPGTLGSADLTTTSSGFIVRVDPTGANDGQHDLRIDKQIPDLEFDEIGSSFSYQIPIDAFVHTDAEAEVVLSAVMLDGSELPDWLRFDAEKGELKGLIPEDFDGELLIRVIARDQDGRQAETLLRIIHEGQNLEPQALLQGRPELDSQLAEHGVLAWKAEQDALVQQAQEAAEQLALAKAS